MSSKKNNINSRVALITGSTSGIGRAIAELLADEGFTIAFHSRTSVLEGEALARSHPKASYTQADLADQKQIKHLISDVLSRHGRLDVLVNNAGINAMIPHASLKEACADIWRSLYEVNVIAPWTLIAEAEQALRKSSTQACPSSIINAIAPGLVDTPMTESWLDAHELWREKSPMGRGAKPCEIAHIASMLISSSYLTGEIILSDGGLNLT